MKKNILLETLFLLLLSPIFLFSQGLQLQFVPGLQVGLNRVSNSSNSKSSDFNYAASLPLMEFDHVGHRMYVNMNMSDMYYRLTSLNRREKMIRDADSYAKNNGQVIGIRIGWVFGNSDVQRIGFSLNGSWSSSNMSGSYDTQKNVSYGSFGGGLVVYRKINDKIRMSIKGGFELLKGGNYKVDGTMVYIEPAISYEIFQSYGVCIQPVVYLRGMKYNDVDLPASPTFTGSKISQFALKIGFSKSLN